MRRAYRSGTDARSQVTDHLRYSRPNNNAARAIVGMTRTEAVVTTPFRLLSVVFGALLVVAGCGKPETAAPPPPVVEVVKVETKTVPIVFSRVAQVQSSREVEVVARVSGFLEKIVYTEGAYVEEGDVMFLMDRKPFEAQLDAAKGELEASKARLWTANANLKRTKPLAEADALSQSDLDQATGEQQAAEAAVYAATANVTQAKLDLGYTEILAPVSGFSGEAKQREGAYLNAFSESADLTYVAKIDPVWVNFSVSQNELESSRRLAAEGKLVRPEGDKYEFQVVLSNGEVYPQRGTLDFTDPTFNQRTGTFTVRAVVANPDALLRPGMFVTANVLGATRPNAVVVPKEAVRQTTNGHVVWLVDDENKTEMRPVITGDWTDDGWIIEEGLSGGEQVVVGGGLRLRPAMQVKPVPPGSAPKPAGDAGSKS